ncbi:MAG: hypothetical protein U0Q16_02740 [Bryobacteraceae bacterium]
MFGRALAVYLTLILTWEYWDRVERVREKERIAYHQSVIGGSAPSETRARVLVPWLAEFGARAIENLPKGAGFAPVPGRPYSSRAFHLSYIILNGLGILLLLHFMRLLAEALYGRILAMFAVTLSACFLWFTFRDQYYHPWSLWEPGIFAFGMYLVHRGRHVVFIALCAMAALVRETTVFLPLGLVIFGILRHRRPDRAAIVALAAWAAVFAAVRLGVGFQGPPADYFPYLWRQNAQALPYTLLLTALLLGPMWFWLARGIRHAPPLLIAFLLSFFCYGALLITVSFWWEIRYWASAIPVLVPLILESVKGEFPPPVELGVGEPGASRVPAAAAGDR